MKAIELLNNTLKILGYADSNGNSKLTQRIRNRAVVTINLVYSDLWHICKNEPFEPIKSVSEEIKLPPKVLSDVFCYGLAMHIAQSENDGDQQQFFAHHYNSKRTGLSRSEKIVNKIPRCSDL